MPGASAGGADAVVADRAAADAAAPPADAFLLAGFKREGLFMSASKCKWSGCASAASWKSSLNLAGYVGIVW